MLYLISIPLQSQAESIKDNSADTTDAKNIKSLKTPDPKTALQHNNRGVECSSKGLWKNAIREHRLALLEDPTNKIFRTNLSFAHLQYGEVLQKKEEILEAMAQLHAALYVDPDNKTAKEKLKDIGNPNSTPVKLCTKIPVPGELDNFLKGKTNTLHGYEAF